MKIDYADISVKKTRESFITLRMIQIQMSESDNFDTESVRVLMRALDYYLKSLRNLEEIEESSGHIPLFEGQVEASLMEIKLIKKELKSESFSGLNIDGKKILFIIQILNFYKNELLEDLEEIENTNNDKLEIDLLEKEIKNVSNMLQAI